MAFIAIPGQYLFYPPFVYDTNSPGVQGQILNAANEGIAFFCQIPKTGTLNGIEFAIQSVSDNPDNGIRCSFRDVAANGNPSAIEDQYRVLTGTLSAGWTESGLMTNDGTDNGTKRSVTIGDHIAIVIDLENFATGDNLTIVGNGNGGSQGVACQYPYNAHWNGSNKLTGREGVNVVLVYDDGSKVLPVGGSAISDAGNSLYGTTSTPDEFGVKFTLPVPVRVIGMWGYFWPVNGSADIEAVLYDENDTELGNATLAGDWNASGVVSRPRTLTFDASNELAADTTYRLVLKPTTTTQTRISELNCGVADGTPWGDLAVPTERTDGGSWTDGAATDDVPAIGLVIDAVDPEKGSVLSAVQKAFTPVFSRRFRRLGGYR